jgi:hypothetical protein
VGFAETDVTNKDNVGLRCHEGQSEQILDLRAVDLLGPTPLEGIESLEHRESGVVDPPLDAAVFAQRGLALNQLRQIVHVRELLFGGCAGQSLIVALDMVQVQLLQLRIQSDRVIVIHHHLSRRR